MPEKRDVLPFFEAVAKLPESSSPDGVKLSESQLVKARAFWAAKAERRKSPHHCSRCAKPNNNGHRQCDECRAYSAAYRARKNANPVSVDASALAHLERRVGNLEHYFARMSEVQKVAYKRGYSAGRRLHRESAERASYFDALPTASAQELASISHEYAR